MSGFVAFLPTLISEGAETITAVESMVEGALAGQGTIDLATTYAKNNPDSKLGKLLNDNRKHTPKIGNCPPKHRRKVG
jgi:hypothetical protein